MREFIYGMILGVIIFSTIVSIVAAITESEDITLTVAIGFGWVYYGIAVVSALIIGKCERTIKKVKRYRRRKEYEKSC